MEALDWILHLGDQAFLGTEKAQAEGELNVADPAEGSRASADLG